MPGAIRPPWIDKNTFLKTPFNFCDRWCERCQFTAFCRVFKEEKERKEKLIKEGKDPYDPKHVFEAVAQNLAKTMELVKKQAQELGIDWEEELSKEELEKERKQFENKERAVKKTLLYRITKRFAANLQKLAMELEIIEASQEEELFFEEKEVLYYYHTLLPAKIHRALLSKKEEEEEEEEDIGFLDSQISAFITINSLLEVSEALLSLVHRKELKFIKPKLLRLNKISLQLLETIQQEFQVPII